MERLRTFRRHDVHVLGSFIFGSPSDRPATFDACVAVAQRSGVAFARFVMLQPLPGTLYIEHPVMTADEIRRATQAVWDQFYSLRNIWKRSRGTITSLKGRLAFVLISKIYRQMYANTGIATDSARVQRSMRWARLMAIPCRWLFTGRLLPNLHVPSRQPHTSTGRLLPMLRR